MDRAEPVRGKTQARFGMVVALTLMIAGALGQTFRAAWAGQPGAGDTQTVAFVVQGALKVQPIRGGAAVPATEAQKTAWRKMQGGDGIAPPQISPDGAYRTTPLTDADRERLGDSGIMIQGGFVLCRSRDGKVVLTPSEILKIAAIEESEPRIAIEQWLPDSRHIVVSYFARIAGTWWMKRFGVDIQARRLSPFNGWLAPNKKTAIAPSQEREASEENDRTDSKDRSGDRIWYHTGPDFHIVAMPPHPETYRFRNAARAKITHGGTPLHIPLDGRVQFSRDSRYALIEAFKKRYSDRRWYLIDLRNGQTRKLDGTEAVLL